jgi:regulator of RNase E activity RraA
MDHSSPAASAVASLGPEHLDSLRQFNSPTIANALESLGLPTGEARHTNSSIRCISPELGVMVGYACTATILSHQPAAQPRKVWRTEYWEYTRAAQSPRVTVMQDLSETPGGAYWGEVNANIHRALSSQGVITNGTVRDIEEARPLGFHFFAGGIQVSHGYAHLKDFKRPVKVFGMLVYPGDLVHADRHGAVVIPHHLAPKVAEAACEIERKERPMITLCQSAGFSIEELDKLIPHAY